MTDAHCHVAVAGATRRFLCPLDDANPAPVGAGDRVFYGVHPWCLEGARTVGTVRAKLEADPRAGVGEIGLDRLRDRTISPRMREAFEAQLRLAAEFRRPVVLHGAKCWGEVVSTIRRVWASLHLSPSPSPHTFTSSPPSFYTFYTSSRPTDTTEDRIQKTKIHCSPPPPPPPPLLFHGFSRSDGLIPDIVALNGYISVGPAVLNDHAVNYRALVKKIPADRLLVETDATVETAAACPPLADIAAKIAELRGVALADLIATLEANADTFVSCLVSSASRPPEKT